MDELKPCPFCGEIPYIEKKPLWRTYNDGTTHGYCGCFEYDIRCHKCGCTIPLGGNDTIYRKDDEAKKNATDAWNRRAESEELEFTRKFIREQGLDFALMSAWNRRAKMKGADHERQTQQLETHTRGAAENAGAESGGRGL